MQRPQRESEEERLARAELADADWEWARNKAIFKEALSEWVKENPTEGKVMVTAALADCIDEIVKTQLQSLGTWTLRGVWALILGTLLYIWWKTVGWKV